MWREARALGDEGLVWRAQADTYHREVERYGGPIGMTLSERIFDADSDAVLAIVELLDGDAGADARWRLLLRGIDLLLDDLGFDLDAKSSLLDGLRAGYRREHAPDTRFDKQLGDRFRKERTALETLLDAAPDADHPLALGFPPLAARSKALAPIVRELRAAVEAGRLTVSLPSLAASLVHMHANRMLRAAARANELVLYDFLARLYEGRRARRRRSPDRAGRVKLHQCHISLVSYDMEHINTRRHMRIAPPRAKVLSGGMHAALLVLTLALPATGADHRVDVSVSVDLQSSSSPLAPAGVDPQYTGPTGRLQSLSGEGSAGVTLFARRLRDDDAPPSLQAFLQRATDVHLGGSGFGGASAYPNLDGSGPGRSISFSGGSANASAEATLGWLYLSLALDVDYSLSNIPAGLYPAFSYSELIVDPSLTAGIRWRRLLLYGGWSVEPYRYNTGSFEVEHWNRARAGFRAVLRRSIDLSASVTVLDGGAAAVASLEVWIARRLGVAVSVNGGHGTYYLDSSTLYDAAGGSVELDCWLTHNEELSVNYTASWRHADSALTGNDGLNDYNVGDSVSHVVTLSFRERR